MPIPLAEKLRPDTLDDIVGQDHLVGNNKPIKVLVESGNVPSIILWGPPGSGKTTLARVISRSLDVDFYPFSAVTGGINDIRKIITEVKKDKGFFNKDAILFIDEIHRFNKAQQDALLPHVEDGTIVLIGATTENPGFYVNAPLLSRSQLYVLKALPDKDIETIVDKVHEIYPEINISKEAKKLFIQYANGDARAVINFLELGVPLSGPSKKIDIKVAESAVQRKQIKYDKKGDNKFDTVSAFIKSMRGGDPDATLHYLARMIEAGEDPMFIARRMLIFASEDVGNANPEALILSTSAMQAVKMIGMPESKLILAQTATYLAKSKKSIASTIGIGRATRDLQEKRIPEIPLHLRNPVNEVVTGMDHGKGHIRYPWMDKKKSGKLPKQDYLPKELKNAKYYDESFSS